MSRLSEILTRGRLFWFLRKYTEKHCLNNVIAPLLPIRGVSVVFDIGARRGDWSESLHKLLPKSEFFLFDASGKYESHIRKKFENFYVKTLSSTAKEVEFYSNGSAGDSYFKENSLLFEKTPSIKVKTCTLDSLIEEFNLPEPDFIKVDTQGSELDVLMGGANSLTSASYVQLELPLIPLNAGAPNIEEVLEFMRYRGFYPHDVIEMHRNKLDKKIWQIDLLFLNSELFTGSDGKHSSPRE